MPVLGTGVLPASGAIANELTYLTRRAFVPKLIVQNIYQATPTLSMLLSNAQFASGGVSPITVPVQGAKYTVTQAAGYDGTFTQPTVTQGAWNAEFNLKLSITPIPFLGMEGLVQVDAAVIPILAARLNDAGNGMADFLSTDLWTNSTDGVHLVGFPGAIAASGTYGGLARGTYSWWKANVQSVSATPHLTRAAALQWIVSATKAAGGEMPDFGVTGPGTWADLASDFLTAEHYEVRNGEGFDKVAGGVRAAFVALNVAGVPIYMDPYSPEGQIIIGNSRYGALYLHEMASFVFTGFQSLLANYQLGYVGALVNLAEFVLMKPSAWTIVTGFTSLTV